MCTMSDPVLLALALLALALTLLALALLAALPARAASAVRAALAERAGEVDRGLARVERALRDEAALSRAEAADAAARLRAEVAASLRGTSDSLGRSVEALRRAVEERLGRLAEENAARLERIRQTVDETLQGTLERRLGESFRLVGDRLEAVQRGLGEMQALAQGVGDLKRVLGNVKTRGTFGEVQLAAILEQLLTPDQYAANVATRVEGGERVEFAIRLPGRGDGEPEVLLPIDAKFPTEDYQRLLDAAEAGDAAGVEAAGRALELRLKGCARDIHDKYLAPPRTTDFAVLFLPTEGLYAEALRRPGLVEALSREHGVTLAGPTTLAAFLSSLRMGFGTLAIQRRSSEVWAVLGGVKAEFARFGAVLDQVERKLGEASNKIGEVRRRGRAIDRRLREVEALPAPGAAPAPADVPEEEAAG